MRGRPAIPPPPSVKILLDTPAAAAAAAKGAPPAPLQQQQRRQLSSELGSGEREKRFSAVVGYFEGDSVQRPFFSNAISLLPKGGKKRIQYT